VPRVALATRFCTAAAQQQRLRSSARRAAMDAPQPPPPASLVAYALAVLSTPCAFAKATLTREALTAWRAGALPPFVDADAGPGAAAAPERPARDASLTLVTPGAAPKRGKGGTPASRLALLHSLAHIESWAIDLSWDIIARFALPERMDRAFYDDWAEVAAEEASHFELLAARLEALGLRYGALAVHDGLWESAMRTADSLSARLAVEHCTHEARGLDVLPQTIGRFRAGGDEGTAALLEQRILPVRVCGKRETQHVVPDVLCCCAAQEEVSHCAKGVRWFRFLAHRDAGFVDEAGVAAAFHACVRANFTGALKPPFNTAARAAAGFQPEWYLPLAAAAPAGAAAQNADEGCQ
jgi:uncharacterized ferritin-like protein (DUF455 family)